MLRTVKQSQLLDNRFLEHSNNPATNRSGVIFAILKPRMFRFLSHIKRDGFTSIELFLVMLSRADVHTILSAVSPYAMDH